MSEPADFAARINGVSGSPTRAVTEGVLTTCGASGCGLTVTTKFVAGPLPARFRATIGIEKVPTFVGVPEIVAVAIHAERVRQRDARLAACSPAQPSSPLKGLLVALQYRNKAEQGRLHDQ